METTSTFTPGRAAVARLSELGIVVEITGQKRNRRFRYEPYVRLFFDEPVELDP